MSRYDELREGLRRRPRTWVITGVAGFIGSSLLNALLELGQSVVGLDNLDTGSRRNVDEVLRARRGSGSFVFHEGDVRDPRDCRAVCRGADYVLHHAALASVPRSLADPAATRAANVEGSLNVFLAARAAGARVVYASSSAVYGDCAAVPAREEVTGAPLSPYALTKRVTEDDAARLARTHGLDAVGLRYFNVFGPRQDPGGAYAAVIPRWTRALLLGEPCHVHGDGETTRDFVWVGDVARANLLAATAALEPGAPRVFNVGGGRRTSLNELYRELESAVRALRPGVVALPRVHGDPRAGDVRDSEADLTRIRAVLGYEPAGRFATCLGVLTAWYLRRHARDAALARAA